MLKLHLCIEMYVNLKIVPDFANKRVHYLLLILQCTYTYIYIYAWSIKRILATWKFLCI